MVGGDTYADTLLNSSATVSVLDAAAQPPPPTGGGPGSGGEPGQQVVVSSSAGSGGDLDVLCRTLWLPQPAYVSGLTPPQLLDIGANIVEPDGWTQIGFTGAGTESLGAGGAHPLVFAPGNGTTQALVDTAAQIMPGVDPIAGRADGLAYVGTGIGELQLIRHIFTMPTFGVPFVASLMVFAKGFVVAATINGLDLPASIPVTTSFTDGTSFVQGDLPSNMLIEGVDNILAIATINIGSGDALLDLAQFVAYSLVITT